MIFLLVIGTAALRGFAQDQSAGAAAELREVREQLKAALKTPEELFIPTQREQWKEKLSPLLKRIWHTADAALHDHSATADEVRPIRLQVLSMLVLLDDREAEKTLDQESLGNSAEAQQAKGAQLLAKWWKSSDSESRQRRVLAEFKALAKAHPDDDQLARIALLMARQGSASRELAAEAEELIGATFTGKWAKAWKEKDKAQRRLADLVGKPLVITGTTLEEKSFSTMDWKGKVVLVDFWATWCPPCVKEIPKIAQLYQANHARGLEVVGVSSDDSGRSVARFLSDNPEVIWPQLFDPKTNELHPIAVDLGIRAIPGMIIIDRKGIVRSVEPGEKYPQIIEGLLADQ